MDGMHFFQNEASGPVHHLTAGFSIRRAVLLTVASVVVTIGVLVGLRMVGAPPLISDEIATAPVAS